jgi:catechol 2,3-dioxygenase-like lactoylglutathione lyase family enzyme
LCYPIENLETSLDFWRRLGFRRVKGSKLPYPWAVISDGLITLGLHETRQLKKAGLVYCSSDRNERMEQLRQEGFVFAGELPSPDVGMGRAYIEAPDGQLFLLMEFRP